MTAFNPLHPSRPPDGKDLWLHHSKTARQEMQGLFAANLLQELGLEGYNQRILNSYPFTLSGGMLQRLMIAAALMYQPRLW